jgi:hypothetical protein
VITNLKSALPPVPDASNGNGEDCEKYFDLDTFAEMWLPPKLMALTKDVNRRLCEHVEVIVGRDGCFLCWDERNAEMRRL